MIALQVSWIMVCEIVRALIAPIRLLAYRPRRRYWREQGAAMLQAAQSKQTHDTLPDFLAGRRLGGGHIFISAGETSGESHAIKLMDAVAAQGGQARWSCFGGPAMSAAGADLRYPLSDRTVMGLAGVFKSLPFLIKAIACYLRFLRDTPPDLVVLLDYPGLHMVMAAAARRRGIPVIHYIAPQYWAWGPWRMRRYRRCVDASLAILPFESWFFANEGIPCEYVGHPLLDAEEEKQTGPEMAGQLDSAPTLCLMPGSRSKEIRLLLPDMLDLARRLRQDQPTLQVVLPHTDPRKQALIQQILQEQQADFVQFHLGSLQPCFRAARLILAKSGTGSLEACLSGTPTVVIYKLDGWIAEHFYHTYLSVPFIASANLIAGREVVPEFCFRHSEAWQEVEQSVRQLLADTPQRQQCLQDLAMLRQKMGNPGASARVARWLLPFCKS